MPIFYCLKSSAKKNKNIFQKMPCQTWQIEILCYIMQAVLITPLLLRDALCFPASLFLFAIKHPPLFHFSGQRVISSFPAPYNTACNSVIFKISRLNAWAVFAFKSICNDSLIPHCLTDSNASAVKVNHYLDFNISGHSGLPDFLDLSVSNHFAQYCFNSCRADIRQDTAYICLGNRY